MRIFAVALGKAACCAALLPTWQASARPSASLQKKNGTASLVQTSICEVLLTIFLISLGATGTSGADDRPVPPVAEAPVWTVGIGSITGISVAPDGKSVAVSTTTTHEIRDANTCALISSLGQQFFVSFVPGGDSILAVDGEGRFSEMDRDSAKVKRPVRGVSGALVSDVKFSNDGRYLAFLELLISKQKAEQVISPDEGGGIRIEHGGTTDVLTGALVTVFSWPTLQLTLERTLSTEVIPSTMSWSSDSTQLILAGQGEKYLLLPIKGVEKERALVVPYIYAFYKASTGDGHSLIGQIAPLGKDLALAVGQSGLGWHTPWTELFVFNPVTAGRVWPEQSDEGGSQAPAEEIQWPVFASVAVDTIAVFSPYRPNIYLIDPRSGSVRRTLRQQEVRAVDVGPDGKMVYAAAPERMVAYSVKTAKAIKECPLAEFPLERPTLSLARNGHGVMSLADGTMREFDASSGHVGKQIRNDTRQRRSYVSEVGQRLVIETEDGIMWYEGLGKRELGRSKGGLWDAYAVAPEGGRLVFGNREKGVTVLKLPEGEKLGESQGGGEIIRFLAFSPDGSRIASLRQWTDSIEIWSAADGKRLGELASPGPGESRANLTFDGTALSYSPDGKLLAAALWNGRGVALWELGQDAATAESSRYLHTPGMGHCLTISFSWDSTALACGEEGGAMTIFDVASGIALQRFTPHKGDISTLRFIEDEAGKGIVTSSVDGTVSRFTYRGRAAADD